MISEGLDGGYEDRIPELVELLSTGTPLHRLLAGVALVSWGHSEGFQRLMRWASDPASAPWGAKPLTFDRIYGADDAFEQLSEALHVSYWNDDTPELRRMRQKAISALLKNYPDHFFGRSLALAIVRDKNLPPELTTEIVAAVEGCIQRLASGVDSGFDLALQAAYLLTPLARMNDERTAHLAERLMSLSQSERMLRELTLALAEGRGSVGLDVLRTLKGSSNSVVAADAEKALSRRQART
jgi:hypothetical protein